jgi:hypothetical protein
MVGQRLCRFRVISPRFAPTGARQIHHGNRKFKGGPTHGGARRMTPLMQRGTKQRHMRSILASWIGACFHGSRIQALSMRRDGHRSDSARALL